MNLNLYNPYRVGDNIFSIKYCNAVLKELTEDTITFYTNLKKWYPEMNWHEELKECGNSTRLNIDTDYKETGVDTWIGSNGDFYQKLKKCNGKYSEFFISHYESISKKLNILNPFSCKDDLYFKHDSLKQEEILYDYCIINSLPQSSQYLCYHDVWDEFVLNMDKKYKLFVIREVEGTTNSVTAEKMKMTMMEIARESTRCKEIIGISTGPLHVIMNDINKDKRTFVFENDVNFDFDNVINMGGDIDPKNIFKHGGFL